MVQAVSALCVLGIVVSGILIMTGIASFEDVGGRIGRALVLLLLVTWLLCGVKGILIATLGALRFVVVWLGVAVVIVIVFMSFLAIITKFQKRTTNSVGRRGEHE